MATKKEAKKLSQTAKPSPKSVKQNIIAVVQIGAHQYSVKPEQTISVEKLNLKKGEKISFDQVLLYSDNKQTLIGTPFVKGSQVEFECLDTRKEKKIRIARFKSKSRYRKLKGHRQIKTKLKTLKIALQ